MIRNHTHRERTPQTPSIAQYTSRTAISQSDLSSFLIASLHHIRHAMTFKNPFLPCFASEHQDPPPVITSRPFESVWRQDGFISRHQRQNSLPKTTGDSMGGWLRLGGTGRAREVQWATAAGRFFVVNPLFCFREYSQCRLTIP
jgi:hypothetical protein